MLKPKFVLFDAGRTLIDYSKIDTLRGIHKLMPHITANPHQHTPKTIDSETNRMHAHFEQARAQLFEIPEQTVLKLVYDTLGIEFDLSVAEIERIIWNESADFEKIAGVDALLDYLNAQNIGTGVICNLDFSSELLKERLDELFPQNQFRFVIASGDYGVRKPRPEIFEAGIEKCGCEPDEIWYVGDKLAVDVKGSAACGMQPILYQRKKGAFDDSAEAVVIEDFAELIKLLETCE